MNPALIIPLLEGALTLIEKMAPVVQQLFQAGEITIEQQKELNDRIKALSASDAFSGPEWEVKQ